MIEGWKTVRLEDICTKGASNIAQNKIVDNVGDYPLYGASGFLKKIDFYQQEKPYIGVVKDGSGVGRVGFYPAKSSLLGTLQYILPKPGYDIRFVGYALKSLDLASFATGAAIPHIYFRDYGKSEICVPPSLKEQQRVVAELDLLTSIIDKKESQLRVLDELTQSIFDEMFGNPISNERGWDFKRLDEVAQIVGGATPKTQIEDYWIGDNYWVTPAELHNERYQGATERTISDEAVRKTNVTLLPAGTVLLSSRAPIGKVAITTVPMYCNQGFKNLICSPALNNEYAFQVLYSNTEYLNSLGTGATFKEISKKTTEAIQIAVPPIKLQNEFANKVKLIEKQKALIKASIKDAKDLLASRMDKYFCE